MDHQSSPCETVAERYQALLEVAEAISVHRDLHELFRDLARRLPRVVQVNFVSLSLHDPAENRMRLQTIQANVPADLVGGHEEPLDETPAGAVWQSQQTTRSWSSTFQPTELNTRAHNAMASALSLTGSESAA